MEAVHQCAKDVWQIRVLDTGCVQLMVSKHLVSAAVAILEMTARCHPTVALARIAAVRVCVCLILLLPLVIAAFGKKSVVCCSSSLLFPLSSDIFLFFSFFKKLFLLFFLFF
jgi:hypothetical protein